MSNFNRTIASLLATENIRVNQASVQTASFSVKTRVLTLPILEKNLEAAYPMFVAHEVGHARYTTPEFDKVFQAASKSKRTCYNVCEDIRIEKLIKRKYPGLRRVMAEGYNVLNSVSFFAPKDEDINDMNFIDRLNIYYKTTIQGIEFSDEEKVLVDKASRTETWMDAKDIGDELHAFMKGKLEDEQNPEGEGSEASTPDKSEKDEDESDGKGSSKEESDTSEDESDPGDGAGDSDGDDSEDDDDGESGDGSDSEGDEEEEDGDGDGTGSGKSESDKDSTDSEGDEDSNSTSDSSTQSKPGNQENPPVSQDELDDFMESKTQQAIDKGIKDGSVTDTVIVNVEMPKDYPIDGVVDYQEIQRRSANDKLSNRYISYRETNLKTINYIFKEFEMRKSAHLLKKARLSKSGALNMNKIFAYKLTDDLFKSVMVVPNQQNHGMLFLLDWSISMHDNLHSTLTQVINLAMFCRKARIPFQVLAFSDDGGTIRKYREDVYGQPKAGTIISRPGQDFMLLEFLSSNMKEAEFQKSCSSLFDGSILHHFPLGYTPLDDALIYMNHYIGKFKTGLNVEKLSFVVLSDGGSGNSHYADDHANVKYLDGEGLILNVNIGSRTYKLEKESTTSVLLNIIGDTHDAVVSGFYVVDNDILSISNALRVNCPKLTDDYSEFTTIATAVESNFNNDKHYEIIGKSGYDKLYLISAQALGTAPIRTLFNKSMDSKQLAQNLTDANKSAISSKVVLGRMIEDFA